jgi:hypothetical protein
MIKEKNFVFNQNNIEFLKLFFNIISEIMSTVTLEIREAIIRFYDPLFDHDKFWLADDVFYLGSHNLYDCNLSEFGYIIEGEEAIQYILNNYWNEKWEKAALPK